MLTKKRSEVVPWLGFFRRDFLTKANLHFPQGVSYTEDQLFLLESLLTDGCVAFDVNDCFYGYRVRENSATTRCYSKKKIDDIIDMTIREIKYESLSKYAVTFASTTLSQIFPFYYVATNSEKKYIRQAIKRIPMRKMIINAYSFKLRIKFIFLLLFPFLLGRKKTV